ncbi:MAG: hypothetical protein ACTHMK_05800 [Dyella sp.]|uniref:hypothetical protein n=1 Tax=Dyella sp. TaxID=1869338 RepID=UPI003F7D4B48
MDTPQSRSACCPGATPWCVARAIETTRGESGGTAPGFGLRLDRRTEINPIVRAPAARLSATRRPMSTRIEKSVWTSKRQDVNTAFMPQATREEAREFTAPQR